LLVIRDLTDRHRRGAREDVRKLALTIGSEVQDDRVRDAEVGRQGAEELLERFDAACGGADAAHGNERYVVHGEVRGLRGDVRPRRRYHARDRRGYTVSVPWIR